MMLKTQEHIDLMEMFEREYRGSFRMDREPQELWARGIIYQDDQANTVFQAYRRGYALGKAIGREE